MAATTTLSHVGCGCTGLLLTVFWTTSTPHTVKGSFFWDLAPAAHGKSVSDFTQMTFRASSDNPLMRGAWFIFFIFCFSLEKIVILVQLAVANIHLSDQDEKPNCKTCEDD